MVEGHEDLLSFWWRIQSIFGQIFIVWIAVLNNNGVKFELICLFTNWFYLFILFFANMMLHDRLQIKKGFPPMPPKDYFFIFVSKMA